MPADPLQFADDDGDDEVGSPGLVTDVGDQLGHSNPFGDVTGSKNPFEDDPPSPQPLPTASGGNSNAGMAAAAASMTQGAAPASVGQPSNLAARAAATSTSYDPEAHTTCSVSQPQKCFRSTLMPGVTEPYMSYLVQTSSVHPSYGGTSFTVRRRFSDFTDLASLLRKTHRGFFVPAHPDKALLSGKMRTDPSFIEKRRRALQDYLNKLAAHDVIGTSQELQMFLSISTDLQNDVQWAQAHPVEQSWLEGAAKLLKQMIGRDSGPLSPSDAAHPTARNHNVVWKLKETQQRRAAGGDAKLSAAERGLRDQRQVLEEFHRELQAAVRGCDRHTAGMAGVAEAQTAAGAALTAWHRFEKTAGRSCEEVGQLATALGQASKLTESAAEACDTHMEGLHAYKDYVPGILAALSDREAALLTVQTLQHETEVRQTRIRELQAAPAVAPGIRAARLSKLQADVTGLEAAQQAATAEYERVMGRNESEMAKLKGEAWTGLNDTLIKYAGVQHSFCKESANIWLEVARAMGADKFALHQAEND